MAEPLKIYQTLNQPPRSMKNHGKHRRADPPSHHHPVVRADPSTGGAEKDGAGITWVAWDAISFTEPKPRTIPYAGIRTGEIIGHRLWWVINEGGEQWLCSLAHRQFWRPAETISGDIDKIVQHDGWSFEPIWGGVYAFAGVNSVLGEADVMTRFMANAWNGCAILAGANPGYDASSFVAGTIKMWGDVVEHETGYRSQFAKLNSIDRMFGEGDLDALRAKYLANRIENG